MSGVAVLVTMFAAVMIPTGFAAYAVSERRLTWRMVAALTVAECAALVGVLLATRWEMSNC
jgi:hypothetical protein